MLQVMYQEDSHYGKTSESVYYFNSWCFVDNSMGLIYDCFLVNIRFTHLLAGFSK